MRNYLEAEARLVRIMAVQAGALTVYRADGSAQPLRNPEHLEGEDTLPGLTIPWQEVVRLGFEGAPTNGLGPRPFGLAPPTPFPPDSSSL